MVRRSLHPTTERSLSCLPVVSTILQVSTLTLPLLPPTTTTLFSTVSIDRQATTTLLSFVDVPQITQLSTVVVPLVSTITQVSVSSVLLPQATVTDYLYETSVNSITRKSLDLFHASPCSSFLFKHCQRLGTVMSFLRGGIDAGGSHNCQDCFSLG